MRIPIERLFNRGVPARARRRNTQLRALVAGCCWAVALSVAAAERGDSDQSSGMLGWLWGKKDEQPLTRVSPDLGTTLARAAAFPSAQPVGAPTPHGTCAVVNITGRPPAARFVAADDATVEKRPAFRITGLAGVPPLVVANQSGPPRFELWELGADATTFARQRNVRLDPEQAQWYRYSALELVCLPQQSQLLAVDYGRPKEAVHVALYLYNARSDQFTRIAERIARDPFKGLPPRYLEPLPAGRDALLVSYHTDAIRLAPEIYVNRHDHVLLFSPRYPNGLPVLTLGVDKGNIQRWTLIGTTLWLEAVDARERGKPIPYIWSLDLAKVL